MKCSLVYNYPSSLNRTVWGKEGGFGPMLRYKMELLCTQVRRTKHHLCSCSLRLTITETWWDGSRTRSFVQGLPKEGDIGEGGCVLPPSSNR